MVGVPVDATAAREKPEPSETLHVIDQRWGLLMGRCHFVAPSRTVIEAGQLVCGLQSAGDGDGACSLHWTDLARLAWGSDLARLSLPWD